MFDGKQNRFPETNSRIRWRGLNCFLLARLYPTHLHIPYTYYAWHPLRHNRHHVVVRTARVENVRFYIPSERTSRYFWSHSACARAPDYVATVIWTCVGSPPHSQLHYLSLTASDVLLSGFLLLKGCSGSFLFLSFLSAVRRTNAPTFVP